eukprot:scaffold262378_cov28-Tisochrysis_lutea.AAC.4
MPPCISTPHQSCGHGATVCPQRQTLAAERVTGNTSACAARRPSFESHESGDRHIPAIVASHLGRQPRCSCAARAHDALGEPALTSQDAQDQPANGRARSTPSTWT